MSLFLTFPSGFSANTRFESLFLDGQPLMHVLAKMLPQGNSFPFYNVKGDPAKGMVFEFSVPGFERDQISVRRDMDHIIVSGQAKESSDTDLPYVVRGIAHRSFERSLQIPDYFIVDSVWMKNGILFIAFSVRVPDHLKPQHFQIEDKQEMPALPSQE